MNFRKSDDFDMEAAVKRMQHYWKVYENQPEYKRWNKKMFLRDALYSIGLGMDEETYGFGKGFAKFITFLRKLDFKQKLKGGRIL